MVVPGYPGTVGAGCCESIKCLVEGDVINRVYIHSILLLFFHSVTFEAKVSFFNTVDCAEAIDVDHAYPALN